jgi:hypothetical protein
MDTGYQIGRVSPERFGHNLLALLWKMGLGATFVVFLLLISSPSVGWFLFAVPIVWLAQALVTRQFLRSDHYDWAAWAYILLGGSALCFPMLLQMLFETGSVSENPLMNVIWQGLPFSFVLLVSRLGHVDLGGHAGPCDPCAASFLGPYARIAASLCHMRYRRRHGHNVVDR